MVGPNRPFADQFPNHVIYALQFFDRWHIGSSNPKLGWLPRLHPCVRVVSRWGGVSLDIPFHRSVSRTSASIFPQNGSILTGTACEEDAARTASELLPAGDIQLCLGVFNSDKTR